ncbi:MAG: cysteine sulfinate desulfinase [Gammaproteobacteria bacterium 39-13]|nr:cysteine desulfurase [Gammaproteobacteria bacterium]OJV88507.1 MAG: cysteine sulfinate desulfinase [Gammaproteobacteria bacterium 39-13]
MTKNSLFNPALIRDDFPILKLAVHGYPLAYLDNAATTQKPEQVVEAMQKYYFEQNANVHRGTYALTEIATVLFENARKKVQQFIHAQYPHECIFVRGTTEAINLVANGFSRSILKPQDEILVSQIEHHANIVPWQLVCKYTGAILRVIPCNDQGELLIDAYAALLGPKTKLVALTHISNVLGTINPIEKMIDMAHQNGTPILIDGAQAVAHQKIDVLALDCDFYAFSAHKMYGPTGVGVLYGKSEWLERLPPYQGGGEMIQSVSFDNTTYNMLPYKFEAGTMAICEAIGLGAAIDYLHHIGFDTIQQHENALLHYALTALENIPHFRFIGQAKARAPVISFVLGDVHPHDIGTILDQRGIAVRTGKHCAEPTLDRFGVNATVRASFAMYNTIQEIERLIKALLEVNMLFKRHYG